MLLVQGCKMFDSKQKMASGSLGQKLRRLGTIDQREPTNGRSLYVTSLGIDKFGKAASPGKGQVTQLLTYE